MEKREYDLLFAQNFPFWNQLKEQERELFFQNTVSVFYKKGAVVHGMQERCAGILLIKSGHLRTYLLSEDGREITLYRLFERDICILSASCVLETITFDVFIGAEEDTEVLLIDSEFFHKMAEKNIYVQCFAYQLATIRFSDVMWAMQQILFMGMDKRLAIFLQNEANKQNSIEIKMTHEQIARYIGSAREVVSRMIKYFVQENIIETFRGGIRIIDFEKLNALM